ncbi:Flp family type IVb pilin [Selenomonas sp. FC4001]|uniref:Flp family type IVb pilin n=1 Tax=Selenomonas sp. FC4001 TaxID=1408313 RepID=UPI0005661085|nr:Flp family type IVb pilin [Selenomonas sp. FC4001]
MKEIINYLQARYLNEKAQGMVEYALIVAFIVGVATLIFGTDGSMQDAVKSAFTKVKTAIG